MGCSMVENQSGNSTYDKKFKIIFWDNDVNSLEELQTSEFVEFLSKHAPFITLGENNILKYYWDEQLIEIDYKSIKGDKDYAVISQGRYFSLVLNNIAVYHGLNRTGFIHTALTKQYDDSDYPALILEDCKNDKKVILALKPRYLPSLDLFREYDEKEQKKLLRPEVLKHFEEQGKIIRGKIDLKNLLLRYDKFD